jgi:hypothetical protein
MLYGGMGGCAAFMDLQEQPVAGEAVDVGNGQMICEKGTPTALASYDQSIWFTYQSPSECTAKCEADGRAGCCEVRTTGYSQFFQAPSYRKYSAIHFDASSADCTAVASEPSPPANVVLPDFVGPLSASHRPRASAAHAGGSSYWNDLGAILFPQDRRARCARKVGRRSTHYIMRLGGWLVPRGPDR